MVEYDSVCDGVEPILRFVRNLIAPSILAADFARLGEEVNTVAPHIDMLHVDVMDGHFVPNISLGIPVIESLRKVTDLKFDCHLMMQNADRYFPELKAAGGDLASVHLEVYPDPRHIATRARDEGMEFSIAINPPTDFKAVEPFVELCDMIVIMGVHPGFGGQKFIERTYDKVRQLKKIIKEAGASTIIEVDGGVNSDNARPLLDAGVDALVAGSFVFKSADPIQTIKNLKEA